MSADPPAAAATVSRRQGRGEGGAPRPALHLPPFFHPFFHESVGSTSEEVARLARDGAPEGTLVWAGEQTAGRGRRGRHWLSPSGNLYCSVLLRPDCAPAEAAQLGFVCGLALAATVERLLPPGKAVTCKWPNDVLIDGRKTAGILLEAEAANDGRCRWVIVGMGANVAWHPEPAEGQFPATSLTAEGASRADPGAVLALLAPLLLAQRALWRKGGFAAVRRAWLARAFGLGEMMTVRLDDRILTGTFTGLDQRGGMILACRQDGGGGKEGAVVEEIVTAGDVLSVRI